MQKILSGRSVDGKDLNNKSQYLNRPLSLKSRSLGSILGPGDLFRNQMNPKTKIALEIKRKPLIWIGVEPLRPIFTVPHFFFMKFLFAKTQ